MKEIELTELLVSVSIPVIMIMLYFGIVLFWIGVGMFVLGCLRFCRYELERSKTLAASMGPEISKN